MKQYLRILFFTITSSFLVAFSNAQHCTDSLACIKFSGYSSKLSKEIKKTLDVISQKMIISLTCNISIIGCCSSIENKKSNRANWDRVNKIEKYLHKKGGYNSDRFIFRFGPDSQDANTIVFSFTNDTIDSVPPYHPSRIF